MASTYLKNFFAEKTIRCELFEILDSEGIMHFIDTDALIETILNTSQREQETILSTLRKIDFVNGDVNHYLKFLAECLIKNF
ncbi:MAG: hypothetical protein M3Q58_04220 [Bacteroidota bacterium]|nr:hypothetical protein [Bacteroidota bacterium]